MDKPTQLIANQRVFTLIRRRTRRTMSLQVKPDLSVVVTAPWRIPPQMAIQFVIQHETWIQKQLHAIQIKNQNRQVYTFKTGDTMRYLGRELVLVVRVGGTRATTQLTGDQLVVSLQNPTPDRVKSCVTQWYKRQAKRIFEDRIEQHTSKVARRPTQIRLSSAKTRWGSCSPTGTISLRWTLVMAPLHVIDYVIIHELCHLVHMNHSVTFWKLVQSIDPNYKAAESQLKSEGIQYEPF